jgi:hypothetical protein
MAHDCFVGIRTVPGCIGVGEAIEGVAVASFDGVKPSLLDRKAPAGMIESNQGTNAGDIQAAWVKWGTCGTSCQGNSLGCTLLALPCRPKYLSRPTLLWILSGYYALSRYCIFGNRGIQKLPCLWLGS